MKNKFLLAGIFCLVLSLSLQGQNYSAYYYQKVSLFDKLPMSSDDIVFLGNSITDGGEWSELFSDLRVKNRGISGDVTNGVYDRLEQILRHHPSKIFLLIGVNDIANGKSVDEIVQNIEKIVKKVKKDSPSTKLYVQSLLPVNDHFNMFTGHTLRWQMIYDINKGIQAITQQEGVTYIDLYSHFTKPDSDKMDIKYSNDGLHLMGDGYIKWIEIVKPYMKE